MTFQIKFLPKYVVLLTSAILLFAFAFYVYYHSYKTPHFPAPVPVFTQGQPTEGNPNASVHVVSFEDPSCSNCLEFHQNAYPFLKRNYIETGLIKYTVVLVSFLPDSRPISMALLCALSQSPKDFFRLLEAFYLNPTDPNLSPDVISKNLLSLAQNLNININAMQNCITNRRYSSEITHNTTYAKDLMGGYIQTPTVYVNGMKIINPTIEQLESFIIHAQKRQKKI